MRITSGRGEGTLKVDNSEFPSNSERVCECDAGRELRVSLGRMWAQVQDQRGAGEAYPAQA